MPIVNVWRGTLLPDLTSLSHAPIMWGRDLSHSQELLKEAADWSSLRWLPIERVLARHQSARGKGSSGLLEIWRKLAADWSSFGCLPTYQVFCQHQSARCKGLSRSQELWKKPLIGHLLGATWRLQRIFTTRICHTRWWGENEYEFLTWGRCAFAVKSYPIAINDINILYDNIGYTSCSVFCCLWHLLYIGVIPWLFEIASLTSWTMARKYAYEIWPAKMERVNLM